MVYLVSPETAALSAITGVMTDPLGAHGIPYPEIVENERYIVDDNMLIFPPKDGSAVPIVRGPNIGEPPKNDPLADRIAGVCTLKVKDKITTDHIMPAGSRLKYRSNIPLYAHYTFEPIDPTFHDRALANRDQGIANIVVAGFSYGQGSSREHAAMCPMYLGVKVVIAKSFERIHYANLCNFGIIGLTFVRESDYDAIEQGDSLLIEDVHAALHRACETGEPLMVHNRTKHNTIAVRADITARQKELLFAGGLLNYTKGKQSLPS